MEKLSYENVDITKLNQELKLETKFDFSSRKQSSKEKQTTLSDFC